MAKDEKKKSPFVNVAGLQINIEGMLQMKKADFVAGHSKRRDFDPAAFYDEYKNSK